MPAWMIFALLAPASFTLVNYVDKFVVSRVVRDPMAVPVFTMLVGLVVGTGLWLVGGRALLPTHDALLLLASGMVTVWAAVFYFVALAESETATVIVLLQVTPVMVLVLAWVFLGQALVFRQIAGFALILAAAIGVTWSPDDGGFRINRAFWFVLATDLLSAVGIVLFAGVVSETGFITEVAYESWGIAIGGAVALAALPRMRRALATVWRETRGRALAVVSVNEFGYVVAKLFGFIALSGGPAALVSVLSGTQVFFGIAYGWVLSQVAPQIFGDRPNNSVLVRNMLLASTLLIGVWLVQ